MKCPNCGRELKTGQMYCESCGREIQIVPDYDPLDELLIGREELEQELPKEPRKSREEGPAAEKPSPSLAPEKKKRFWKKRIVVPICLLLCVGTAVGAYLWTTRSSSYSYQLRHGKALLKDENYEAAIPYLERAARIQDQDDGAAVEPYACLARAYAGAGENQLAAESMETAVQVEESARGGGDPLLELYLEYMDILNETGQTERIEGVIEDCAYEEIRRELLPYRIEKPSCSLPEGTYSYYLRLELSAEYGTIYYTLDGSIPTAESTRYEKPVELHEEGETLLSAVAVNEKGMASDPLVLIYKLEFQDDVP